MPTGFSKSHPVPEAERDPLAMDLFWAAGFLEGEGSFGIYSKDKSTCNQVIRVSAGQKQREPLDMLQMLFGGSLYAPRATRAIWMWVASSHRASRIMETLYPLMSPRRQQQITTALQKDRAYRQRRGTLEIEGEDL